MIIASTAIQFGTRVTADGRGSTVFCSLTQQHSWFSRSSRYQDSIWFDSLLICEPIYLLILLWSWCLVLTLCDSVLTWSFYCKLSIFNSCNFFAAAAFFSITRMGKVFSVCLSPQLARQSGDVVCALLTVQTLIHLGVHRRAPPLWD